MTSAIGEIGAVGLGAIAVQDLPSFEKWVQGTVQPFLPSGMVFCALGRLRGTRIVVDSMHTLGYPHGYQRHIAASADMSERSVIRDWLRTGQPQLIPQAAAASRLGTVEFAEYQALGMMNIAAHGVITHDASQATYFSFSRLREPFQEDLAERLGLLIPYMHQAFTRVHYAPPAPPPGNTPQLTPREQMIVKAISRGLTNEEIALAAHRSAHTIKRQVADLFKKLGVTSRSQAVALALSLGLCD